MNILICDDTQGFWLCFQLPLYCRFRPCRTCYADGLGVKEYAIVITFTVVLSDTANLTVKLAGRAYLFLYEISIWLVAMTEAKQSASMQLQMNLDMLDISIIRDNPEKFDKALIQRLKDVKQLLTLDEARRGA